MYFKISCPNCGQTLTASDEHIGRRVRCPHCRRLLNLNRPAELKVAEEAGEPSQTPLARPHGRGGSSTQVALAPSGGVAVLVATAFYALLVMPFYKSYFGALFTQRGWVPYVIVFLSSWAGTILVMKYRRIKKQRAALLFDMLPTTIHGTIRPENVDDFTAHIDGLPYDARDSFLVARVRGSLEHFKARKSAQEVAGLLSSQAEIDATAVQSSYTVVKVFIWAIPILGFIGTVIGIGAAVGGFSSAIGAAQDLSVIKDSLGGVTKGLGVAFDTTLVALVMSILVMFPASSMQKTEEDAVNSIDEYCNANLLPRLDEGEAADLTTPDRVRDAIVTALAAHQAELRAWTGKLEGVGDVLTKQIGRGWDRIHAQLRDDYERVSRVSADVSAELRRFLDDAKEAQKAQLEEASNLVAVMTDSAVSTHNMIAGIQETQVTQFKEVLSKLADELGAMREQVRGAREADILTSERLAQAGEVAERAGEQFERLAEAVGTVNSALGDEPDVGALRRFWRGIFGRS